MQHSATPSLKVAITGGIGSGKSVVASIARAMGYKVFDCDIEARRLMEADPEIKRRIAAEVCPSAIDSSGRIDRKCLADAVFDDPERLNRLNSIVHGAVRQRLSQWFDDNRGSDILFVETAILYQSGLDRMVDEVIEVVAPEEIRILRVMRRNNLPEEEVVKRVESQRFVPASPHPNVTIFDNSGDFPLLPQFLDFVDRRKNCNVDKTCNSWFR